MRIEQLFARKENLCSSDWISFLGQTRVWINEQDLRKIKDDRCGAEAPTRKPPVRSIGGSAAAATTGSVAVLGSSNVIRICVLPLHWQRATIPILIPHLLCLLPPSSGAGCCPSSLNSLLGSRMTPNSFKRILRRSPT